MATMCSGMDNSITVLADAGIVDKVIKDGFHIVCKSSVEGTFRLSFSNAETLLVGNLADLQHTVLLNPFLIIINIIGVQISKRSSAPIT